MLCALEKLVYEAGPEISRNLEPNRTCGFHDGPLNYHGFDGQDSHSTGDCLETSLRECMTTCRRRVSTAPGLHQDVPDAEGAGRISLIAGALVAEKS